MAVLNTLSLPEYRNTNQRTIDKSFIKRPDPMTGVLLGVVHGAASGVRRAREQLAVGDVVGEGFLVEDAGAPHHCPVLPGCEGAAKSRDGGIGSAETDTLLQENTYKLL